MKVFDVNNKGLRTQFDNINWISDSGVSEDELQLLYDELMRSDLPKCILKAKTFEMIAEKSRIAIDPEDIFQDKLFGGKLMVKQRGAWEKEVINKYLSEEFSFASMSNKEFSSFDALGDYGHTSPNSLLLVNIGISGLLERVNNASARDGLTEKQKNFYESCRIVLNAMITVINRLADAIEPYDKVNSDALRNIAVGAPGNIYEAMQLIIIYFFLHEYVAGTRVRTLGRVDVMLYPFYVNDIKNGTFTKEEVMDMLRFFLNKFWSAKVPYDLPFCLSGMDADGNDVTNEMSYMIVEAYNSINIYSPKIHIRVSDKTPAEFVKLVLRCIRAGNSSFVFVNDNAAIKGLVNVGIEEKDARNYTPIGCYEPAVWGVEIGCTGNGGVNLAKAVEFVVTNGLDHASGKVGGVKTGKIESFEDFLDAVKAQIKYLVDTAIDYIVKIEPHYDEINPDPILSSMYDHSVETGVDVFEGGAKYNSSSYYFRCIASLVDSAAAVKRLVFDEKRLTFDELCGILKNNWEGNEKLRLIARNLPEKYGNNNEIADGIAKDITDYCASLVTNRPNGRGGVFKAALFSIDKCFAHGAKTMATPDGRYAGEPLSKNLCAVTAMDRNGITALINSVTKIDHSKFPNGSVLDVVLHPSAVSGEDGLNAFYGILLTYMKKGGFAMHGNVFNAEDLKAAQREPEKYANLQVRVCGWNVYFVNLSKAEQDAFIKQAENVM